MINGRNYAYPSTRRLARVRAFLYLSLLEYLIITFDSMPVDHVNVFFKPNSFFDKNPSMDVPGANDEKSALVNESCH